MASSARWHKEKIKIETMNIDGGHSIRWAAPKQLKDAGMTDEEISEMREEQGGRPYTSMEQRHKDALQKQDMKARKAEQRAKKAQDKASKAQDQAEKAKAKAQIITKTVQKKMNK